MTDRIVDAIKSGAVKRLIVMAGCDGKSSLRNYYTETASKLPPDTIILTAGCAKYRYNKLDSGNFCSTPRIIDAGQCNDCFSLAVFLLHLKDIFQAVDLNSLPFSFDIAWYEQRAVAVLLALLASCFKNIRLGPTLPAFLSPGTRDFLHKNFDLLSIGTPESDIKAMTAGQ